VAAAARGLWRDLSSGHNEKEEGDEDEEEEEDEEGKLEATSSAAAAAAATSSHCWDNETPGRQKQFLLSCSAASFGAGQFQLSYFPLISRNSSARRWRGSTTEQSTSEGAKQEQIFHN
jgi:hypothetical protein